MNSSTTKEKYYLEISSNPVRFQPVSTVTNVFFDYSNRQVFAVRSGGATGVVVKGPTEESSTSFIMEDKGPVMSIKFSPNQKILAIHRSKTSVEFVNFPNDRDSVEYSQSCKGKNAIILGFVWTGNTEIAFITDHGIELFQVIPDRRMLKALRSQNASANWFVECPQSGMVLLSSGSLGHTLQPFLFKPGNIVRLPKFEVDPPSSGPPSGIGGSGVGWGVGGPRTVNKLPERDVTLGVLYGNPSVLVLRHHRPRPSSSQHPPLPASLNNPASAPPRSLHFSRPPSISHSPSNNPPLGAEIVIYTLQGMSNPKKSHILELNMSGRFAVNIVDNLVIVHHEASKTSVLFDIGLPGEIDGGVTRHHPVAPPRPIRPFSLRIPQPLHAPSEPAEIPCELYSANWVVFQPDVIIDAKIGCLWSIGIQLEPLAQLLLPSQAARLAHFLTLRSALGGEARRVLLSIIKELVLMPSGTSTETSSYVDPNPGSRLSSLAAIFDRLNQEYRRATAAGQLALPASGSIHLSALHSYTSSAYSSQSGNQGNLTNQQHVMLDQSDMYTNIFCRMGVNRGPGEVSVGNSQQVNTTEISEEAWWAGPQGRFASAVLVEYIRSLSEHSIPVAHYLQEMLINALVRRGAFFQLHQFLQYHVFEDSKPLACLLLSLENVYPAAHTLALDMMRRLSKTQEEIVEVLLSKQQILPALRFVRSHGSVDQVSARKFLEAAIATGDPVLFASVYKFFEGRNMRLRGNPSFPKGEHWDVYVKHYQKLFGGTGPVRAVD